MRRGGGQHGAEMIMTGNHNPQRMSTQRVGNSINKKNGVGISQITPQQRMMGNQALEAKTNTQPQPRERELTSLIAQQQLRQ